jgi:hypothetical protein
MRIAHPTSLVLGITTPSLQGQVHRIERIADQEQGALQVYLGELRSVTVAAVNGLTRVLRDRAGEFLLVLTSDYEDAEAGPFASEPHP